MSQAPQGPVVHTTPEPNVYTVFLVVAIVALAVAIGFVLHTLMAPVPAGYGVQFGDLLSPVETLNVR